MSGATEMALEWTRDIASVTGAMSPESRSVCKLTEKNANCNGDNEN